MITEVLAPMPGKILQVMVSVGDKVNEEDELFIIEAMKMENPVLAPVAGTVKEIKVKEKQNVETAQVLMIIE